MNKFSNKMKISQPNKNNKTKPQKIIKKEYLESYAQLKKSIMENQRAWKKEQSDTKS